MWESASSISKVCGKGGKQHHRFPGFPQTVISTACLDHRELSGGDLHRCIRPVLLELHRADVVQRRVHSCSVIPEQPRDGFILGLPDRFKTLAVQSFHLQRTEQRLRAGVVPAVALAAHRRRNAMLFEYLTEVGAGVLAAAIAMEDQPRLLTWIALEPGHLESIDHKVTLHIRPHRPAHHSTAEQIDHYSQEQPAFLGRNIGQITNPRLVGRGHDELAIKHVGRNRKTVLAVSGGNAEPPLATSLDTVLLHQPLHPKFAHANALRPQLPPDARPSIRAAILRIDGADMNQQCSVAEVPALGNIHTPRPVFMVARDAHQQYPALNTDRPDQLVALNKGVLHFWLFAKYAVAFPRMSRSIVTRANSARRRLFSICSAVTCGLPLAPFKVPARYSLTQLPNVCSTTPRLRAADAWLWPDSTSRAASCLNSSVYLPRFPFLIFATLSY